MSYLDSISIKGTPRKWRIIRAIKNTWRGEKIARYAITEDMVGMKIAIYYKQDA